MIEQKIEPYIRTDVIILVACRVKYVDNYCSTKEENENDTIQETP